MLAAGAIDTTFGGGAGVATVGYRLTDAQKPAVVATQDDGKILVAWNGATAGGSVNAQQQPPLFLARYNPDGTPDSTFGGTANGQPAGTPAGVVAFANDRVLYNVSKIVPIAGGKVVLAGQSKGGTTQEDVAVVRLNSDGQLDSTFGGATRGFTGAPAGAAFFDFGGRSSTAFDSDLADHATAADVSSTGEIVVAAYAQQGQNDSENKAVAILLLQSDGTLDTAFASSGKYVFSYDSINGGNTTIYQLPTITFDVADNIILDVEKTTRPDGLSPFTFNHTYLRFAPTGTPDVTMGTSPTLPFLVTADAVRNSFPLPDGTLLYTAETQYGIGIGHLNSDLTTDGNFGTKGLAIMVTPDGNSFYNTGEQIAATPDGRFYVAAQYEATVGAPVKPVYLSRFDAQGVFDATFGLVKIADGSNATNNNNQPVVVGPVAIAVTTTTNNAAVPVLTNRFLQTPADLIDRYDLLKVDGGAGIVLNSKGTLTVGGTSDDDSISLGIRARDGKLIVRVGTLAMGMAPSKVKRIRIYGQDGDDTVTIGTGVKGSYISGGNGADTVTGGDGPDILEGGSGDDSLLGGAGPDKIAGFDGADFLSGGGGADQLDGGNDADTINGDSGNDKLYGGFDGPDTLNGSSGTDLAEDDPMDTRTGIETLLT